MVEVAALRKLKRDELELMAPWIPPDVWPRGHDLTLFVDAIVHLLFLGICKTMAMSIERWFSVRGKRSGFESFFHSLLPVVKHLGLDYCRVEPYTGEKLGGRVSDSYLALCRLACWLYSALYGVTSMPDYVQPTLILYGPRRKILHGVSRGASTLTQK
jgi:hypothetical protein